MGGKLLNGRRISRTEADRIVVEFCKKYAEFIETWQICGSYRRGKRDVGDIDLVIKVHKDNRLRLSLAIQKDFGVPWDHVRKPILWDGAQLEVHICTEENWGAMLLYATGSGGYNAGLRLKAAEMGFKLNRYGLWCADCRIAGATEEEIYERLGKPYKSPEDRQ